MNRLPARVVSGVPSYGFGAINLNDQLQSAATLLVQDLTQNNCSVFQNPVTSVSNFQTQYNAAGGGAAVSPVTGKPGLDVDGYYGPNTGAALQEVLDAMPDTMGTGQTAPDPCVAAHQSSGGGGSGGSGGSGGGGGTAVVQTPSKPTGTSQAGLVPWATQNVTVLGANVPMWLLVVGAAGALWWAIQEKTKNDRHTVRHAVSPRRSRRGRRRNPVATRYRRQKAAKRAKRMVRNAKGQFVGKRHRGGSKKGRAR